MTSLFLWLWLLLLLILNFCFSFQAYENDRYTSRTASGGSYSERSRNYGSSRYDNRRYDRGGPPRYGDSSVGSRRDPREPIIYKDLDAPEDIF